jgi:hypothetical protein
VASARPMGEVVAVKPSHLHQSHLQEVHYIAYMLCSICDGGVAIMPSLLHQVYQHHQSVMPSLQSLLQLVSVHSMYSATLRRREV